MYGGLRCYEKYSAPAPVLAIPAVRFSPPVFFDPFANPLILRLNAAFFPLSLRETLKFHASERDADR